MDINIFESGWNDFNVYVFGLIMSDGCLTPQGRNKTMECVWINLNDKEMIEYLHNRMCIGNKIYRQGKNYSLKYRNTEGITFMKNFKLVQRKSLTIQFPDLPDEYIRHFIRGYFDGDGSIVIKNTKYNTYAQTSITCGSFDFLESMMYKLRAFNIKSNIYKDGRSNNGSYYLRQTKRSEVEKMFDFMYKDIDKNNMLLRKYTKYQNYINNTKLKYNIKQ